MSEQGEIRSDVVGKVAGSLTAREFLLQDESIDPRGLASFEQLGAKWAEERERRVLEAFLAAGKSSDEGSGL